MTRKYCDFCGKRASSSGNFIATGGWMTSGVMLYHANTHPNHEINGQGVDVCDECKTKIKDFLDGLIIAPNSILKRDSPNKIIGTDSEEVKEGESK